MTLNTIERLLLNREPKFEDIADTQSWFENHRQCTQDIEVSLDRAMLAGFCFAQTAFVFASAYQSALESMFGLPAHLKGAFCHTEKGVKKPRDMASTLYWDGEQSTCMIDATKSFVSGGDAADRLFISVVDERPDRQVDIKIVQLDRSYDGLKMENLPTLPFVPELSHASLHVERAKIAEEDILPGDGYSQYIKPFRTEEDLHILTALIAQRLRLALELKQHESAESFTALLVALAALQDIDRSLPSTHLVLAGLKQQMSALFKSQDQVLQTERPEFFSAWQRDKALLDIASSAQHIRTKRAWESMDYSK